MLFSSYEFVFLFLPAVFALYFLLNRAGLAAPGRWMLVLASLFFYSYWNIVYLPLIVASLTFNYVFGLLLSPGPVSSTGKRCILGTGIAANVLLLGYFKYSDFFIDNINRAFGTNYPLLNLALPLAISFFTFQQIAYLVDSYKGRVAERGFLAYALFVTFFPQLIAGPIVHHREMMPQFTNTRNLLPDYRNISAGLFVFSIGLFKKVVIADNFAIWSDAGFNNAGALNMFEAWITSLSFGFQLYFDFTGYVDMATGAALMFNIRLPVSFRSPYRARNIQEFWNRWHITLSRFLRDYISIPLKRLGAHIHVNILLTFLISGIWHGAGWTFVVWGLSHGVALVAHDLWKRLGFTMHYLFAWFITFNFLNVSRVFFRAENMDQAKSVLKAMFAGKVVLPKAAKGLPFVAGLPGVSFGNWNRNIGSDAWTLWALAGAFMVILFCRNSAELTDRFQAGLMNLLYCFALILCSLFFMGRKVEFVYFNF